MLPTSRNSSSPRPPTPSPDTADSRARDPLLSSSSISDGSAEWMERMDHFGSSGSYGKRRGVLASVRTSRASQVTVVGLALMLVLAFVGGGSGALKGQAGEVFVNSGAYSDVDEGTGKARTREQKLESLYGMGEFEGRTWIDHIMSLDDRGLAPLTKFTQTFLYEWQNPPLEECANKTFYIPELKGEHKHGLGATAHVQGWSLRNAIDVGAIFAWHPSSLGQGFVDPSCLTDGVLTLDCLFEPTTHCPRSSFKNIINGDQLGQLDLIGGSHNTVPDVLVSQLEETLPFKMEGRALTYWWRGQAAAYTMRLNRASLAYITASRLNATSHFTWEHDSASKLVQSEMPWPLPEGTQSMHVRHGDKGIEMKLIDFRDYVTAGERLSAMNPYSYYKLAFVSSEDPAVLEDARGIWRLDPALPTPNRRWRWYGSEIQRINSGPYQQLNAFGNRSETTLSWMAELMIALECDAFIGTRNSNWNRLIDELRCIWIDSCKGPFVEVGTEQSWRNLGW